MSKELEIKLDYENKLLLYCGSSMQECILNSGFYKRHIKRKVESAYADVIVFKEKLPYSDLIRIANSLSEMCEKQNWKLITTAKFKDYIAERNLFIQKRASVGISIKNKEDATIDEFNRYSYVVKTLMARTLREKQLWDSFFMYVMRKSCNFSVPGSGKTATILGTYAYLKEIKKINKIVMIGPKNSFGSWIDEFNVCFKDKERLNLFNIQEYEGKNNKLKGIFYESGNANLILINYDSLRTQTYLEAIKTIIDHKTLLVFDEVHKIKRVKSGEPGITAKGALDVAENAKYVIALTGTPIPNSYLDLYNLFHILFHEEYKEFFGFSLGQLREPSENDMAEINQKLQPFFCRTTKKQLQVPDVEPDKVICLESTSAEERLFNILYQKYKKCQLALLIRLLQLESDPKMLLEKVDLSEFDNMLNDSENIEEIDFIDYSKDVEELIETIQRTSKMEAVEKLIEKLVSEGKKVIVWCVFKRSIEKINAILDIKGISAKAVYGEIPLKERFNVLDSFKNGQVDVLITNPHTLAESVSLHYVCHDAIYFEYTYNLVHLLQSKDRIHRLGLTEDKYTQYYYLQASYSLKGNEYSMDKKIYERLLEKEQIMLDAIDNNKLEKVYSDKEDLEFIFGMLQENNSM